MTVAKSSAKPVVRRTLSAAEMHQRVLAQSASEVAANASGTVRVLKVEVSMAPKAKVEGKGSVKVTAQRVGVEVKSDGQPRAKGPLPIGLLLPGTYTADEYQMLIRDAGRRPMTFAGTGEIQRYPAKDGEELGAPKMMVDPMARIVDEQLAISGFCGYLLPHMDGSREAGPHGAQLANANRQAYRLASTGRGCERMSHGAFPLPAASATTKAHTRSSAPTQDGYIKGMPDADRKLILDYLKREELTAFNFRMHESAASDALAKLEADLDGANAEELDRLVSHHETQREVERQRLVEIRRVLASKGVVIAPTMLERDIDGEGDVELSAPSANGAKTECAGCEDEGCLDCYEDVNESDEVIVNVPPRRSLDEIMAERALPLDAPLPTEEELLADTVDVCAATERDPIASLQKNTPVEVSYTVDADGCIVEPELSIEQQIAALKAANAELRGETPAPKGKTVEVGKVVDIDALTSDADLLGAIEGL